MLLLIPAIMLIQQAIYISKSKSMLLLIPAIMLIQQVILYLANLNNAIIDTSNHVDTTSNLYQQI